MSCEEKCILANSEVFTSTFFSFSAASARHTTDWTQYEEVGSRPPINTNLTSAGEGYTLLGFPEQPATDAPPALSSQEITVGYTLVGLPGNPSAVTNGKCPLRPGSTYAKVRKEGEPIVSPWTGPPSQIPAGEYSCLAFPGRLGKVKLFPCQLQ